MGLYKRKRSKTGRPDKTAPWWVRFRVGNVEVRQSTGTSDRGLAEQFEQKLRDAYFKRDVLGEKPPNVWQDATDLWFSDKRHKRDIKGDHTRCAWFDTYLKDEPLNNIDNSIVTKIRTLLSREKNTSGTVNKYLAFLRAVLIHAHESGLCNPPPPIKSVKGKKFEPRTLTEDEQTVLLAALAPHARVMAEFAIETGLRSANIRNLEWQNVDMPGEHLVVLASASKSAQPIGIPLSDRAVTILKAQQGKHERFVFVDQLGRAPVGSIKTAWLRATKRAGLSGLRFHDLRHTWTTRMIKSGAPTHAVQELGGWQSSRMVDRYAHLKREDLRKYVK